MSFVPTRAATKRKTYLTCCGAGKMIRQAERHGERGQGDVRLACGCERGGTRNINVGGAPDPSVWITNALNGAFAHSQPATVMRGVDGARNEGGRIVQ